MKKNPRTKQTIVFISHNKADKNAAREAAVFLTAEGINVWFDEWKISAGDSIVQAINEGLHGCTHFIILWSKNAAKSHWVRRELQSTIAQAIDVGSPRVIPILLDKSPLPPLLSDSLYIRYQENIEENRKHIVKAVTSQLPSDTFIQAIVKKYHEVINNPGVENKYDVPIGACPQCGNTKLSFYEATIFYEDDPPIGIKCEACLWTGIFIPPRY